MRRGLERYQYISMDINYEYTYLSCGLMVSISMSTLLSLLLLLVVLLVLLLLSLPLLFSSTFDSVLLLIVRFFLRSNSLFLLERNITANTENAIKRHSPKTAIPTAMPVVSELLPLGGPLFLEGVLDSSIYTKKSR